MKFRLKGMPLPNALDYFGIDNVKEISISSLEYDEHMTEFIYLDIFPYDDMIRRKEKKGIRETFFQGYSNVKQFTSPDYSSVVLPDEKDFRRTLYWNPNVKTDKEGKASVGFYNNRMSNKIKIEVESFIK